MLLRMSWFKSKGVSDWTSITSISIPKLESSSAASLTIRRVEPYETTVMSFPLRTVSTTPSGTRKSPRLLGSFSFKRYPFKDSITRAGSLPSKRVLYIPAACVILRGTSTNIPRRLCTRLPMGEPECQIPSSLCPRVRTISGHTCFPLVR